MQEPQQPPSVTVPPLVNPPPQPQPQAQPEFGGVPHVSGHAATAANFFQITGPDEDIELQLALMESQQMQQQ